MYFGVRYPHGMRTLRLIRGKRNDRPKAAALLPVEA